MYTYISTYVRPQYSTGHNIVHLGSALAMQAGAGRSLDVIARKGQCKGTVVPVHVMKAYGGVDVWLCTIWRRLISLTSWPLYPRGKHRPRFSH